MGIAQLTVGVREQLSHAMLTLCSLPAAALLFASPAPTVRSAARTASATHLLDGKYRSPPSLLVAFPQSREQKGQRGQGASPLQFLLRLLGWRPSVSVCSGDARCLAANK